MDLRGLDLNLLIVLDVLFQERNVTRTSERIHLSQSATSSALSRLREYFEDDLLIPIGKKMVLTPRAETLVGPVRDFLLQAQAIIGSADSFEPGTASHKFAIMMSDYATLILAPELIPLIEKQAPLVTIDIHTELDSPIRTLDHGDIDLLILPHEAVDSQRHPSEDLFTEDYVCVAWSGNVWLGDTISFEQYLTAGHVGLSPGKKGAATIDAMVLGKLGYHRRIEIMATTFNLVPELVVGTNRIATVHRRLAIKQCAYLPIRLLELPIKSPSFTEAIHWHKNRDGDLAIRWLRSLVHEAAYACAP